MLDTATQPEDQAEVIDPSEAPFEVPAKTLRGLGRGQRREGIKKLRAWLMLQTSTTAVNRPTNKPPTVRVAVPADEAALLKLMLLDVEENAPPIASTCPEKIMEHIQAGTNRRGTILGVIDGPEGTPIACINLSFFQWWWSRAYFLQEVWSYVHPDHRKSQHAKHLMEFARWCSDDMTAGFGYQVWLLQGVTSRADVDRKVAFYARHGNYLGAFFLYPDMGHYR